VGGKKQKEENTLLVEDFFGLRKHKYDSRGALHTPGRKGLRKMTADPHLVLYLDENHNADGYEN
jgi:hypothetical protein